MAAPLSSPTLQARALQKAGGRPRADWPLGSLHLLGLPASVERNGAMSDQLRIAETRGWRDTRRFLSVPDTVYRGNPYWVPPLKREVGNIVDRRRNPFFEHGEACFWIAWRGSQPVGRISAQINRLHLDRHQDRTGNFGMLEAIDDPAVFAILLGTAEAWLRERGMVRIIGPYNLSINDEIGVLISGFDSPPMVGMAYAPRYFGDRIEAAGYSKVKDVHALSWDVQGENPRQDGQFERIVSRAKADCQLAVRQIDMRRLDEEMRLAIDIYNDAWSDNWGFVPVNEREIQRLIATLRPIIQSKYLLFGEVNGRPEAIFMSIVNINEVIADLRGSMFPFGWAKLLWRIKRHQFKTGRVMLVGVRKTYRDSLISPALISWLLAETISAGKAAGVVLAELSWVLEDNARSMALCRRAGGQIYKTYRIYGKALA
jgi:hypothetical protein